MNRMIIICFIALSFLLPSVQLLETQPRFSANMIRHRFAKPLMFFNKDPLNDEVRDAQEPFQQVKEPIIKRFKPCYYSPIQCLIKK
ncbi:unnamed protein product [Caenorhabditis bovis]|uniref:Uncharacterized protein n=1 Tax=Caenorhabditis bovis TaxID=2654633 RepID=A0A8S1F3D0_9PELO|nr:unnamed protein product [Caenorhabditis bovis]